MSPPVLAATPPDYRTINVKMMVIIYDPIIEYKGNKRLHEVFGWGDPNSLTNQYISDLNQSSHGRVNYQVVENVIRDEWPLHANGQRFTDESYVSDVEQYGPGHPNLGAGDYVDIIRKNNIEQKVNDGQVDEVILWGFPGTGWWESTLAGPGAYWINGSPVSGINTNKVFALMGLNYERDVEMAIHSYGHRTEAIMHHTFGSWNSVIGQPQHDWDRFGALDYNFPGNAGLGDVHHGFNAEIGTDYNYSSTRSLPTTADDWQNFPNLTGATTIKNCTAWGCNGHGFLKWWYSHIPYMDGVKDGVLNTWWRYIADPDAYKNNQKFGTADTDFSQSTAGWGINAESANCSLSIDSAKAKLGTGSLKFATDGGFDTTLQYPAANNANWNLTDKNSIVFWAYAENANGFQNNSPWIYLKNSNGSYYRYQANGDLMNEAIGQWKRFVIPLQGNSTWTRTTSGTPTLTDIDSIEIHNDTWDFGFTIWYDDLGFTKTGSNPSVSITAPANNTTVSGIVPISASAADDTVVFQANLFVNGSFVESDSVAPFKFRWNTENLPGGTYSVYVEAIDSEGNKSQSSSINLLLSTPTVTPPAAPSNVVATPINGSTIRITWNDNSSNESGFEISNGVTSVKVGANVKNYDWDGLTQGKYMCFQVRSYNAGGNSAYVPSGWACATTPTVPAAPSTVGVGAVNGTVIRISWNDNSNNETGFEISNGNTSVKVGANVRTYDWGGLTPGQYMCFQVRSYNLAGNSAYVPSNWACTSTIKPPTAPSNPTATPISKTQIKITWKDNSNNETGFEIYNGTTYTKVGANQTSRTFSNLAPGTYMCFKIRAYNSAGNSAFTDPWKCATTPK